MRHLCGPGEIFLLDAGIVFANSANRPRADVAYSICALARMSKTKSWIVGSLFVYLGSSSLSVYLCRLIILDSIISTRLQFFIGNEGFVYFSSTLFGFLGSLLPIVQHMSSNISYLM
ncbi:hypothetical protein VPH35_028870 [Triticum aestivum]